MDPVTIAGLALGIAPLIISVVENYEYTFQPFVTYRRYAREIDNFATRLAAQKAIFNNQCQILLLTAEKDGRPEDLILDNILKDSLHDSRRNEALNRRLELLLGASLTACLSILRLIQRTLDDIMRETRSFEAIPKKKVKTSNPFSHFRPRIKISFSKTRLNDTINELRLYNDDLRVLCNQVCAVTKEKRSQDKSPISILSEFRTTKQASENLYNILRSKWVCQTQVDHAASLSLNVVIPEHCQPSGVRFSLSLNCIPSSTSTENAVWVNFESMPLNPADSRNPNTGELSNLTTALGEMGMASRLAGHKNTELLPSPRGLGHRLISSNSSAGSHAATDPSSSSASISTLSTQSTIRTSTSSILSRTATLSTQSPTGSSTSIPAPLSSIEKLCPYFRSRIEQNTETASPAVFSETTTTFEHKLYKRRCPSGYLDKTKSLKQILQEDVESRRRQAWDTKFKLARLLTLGVLRFQSTPWLEGNFNSGNIHFLENVQTPSVEQKYSFESPYLNVQLSPSINSTINSNKPSHLLLTRNELLFNLGVMLLELGYDAPLHTLRQPEDGKLSGTIDHLFTDFFTAKRLGKCAARELDARYGRIAKKCLDCDFGVGEDLGSMELQFALVVNIVDELDGCVKLDGRINSILAC